MPFDRIEYHNTVELFISGASVINGNDAGGGRGDVGDPSPRPGDAHRRADGHRLLLLRQIPSVALHRHLAADRHHSAHRRSGPAETQRRFRGQEIPFPRLGRPLFHSRIPFHGHPLLPPATVS